MELDGEMVDPLQNTQYTFEYIGEFNNFSHYYRGRQCNSDKQF